MSARWFEDEFGLAEPHGFGMVQAKFSISSYASDSVPGVQGALVHELTSHANGRSFHVGPFECAALWELRQRTLACCVGADAAAQTATSDGPQGGLRFSNISGDAYSLHTDPENSGCVFQVASQFNCLEMVGPGVTPETGITQYYRDHTQGPACAMACPAATLFRNYFCNDGRGQAGGSTQQIDTAKEAGAIVGNTCGSSMSAAGIPKVNEYWRMQNGYLLPVARKSMARLCERLRVEDGLMQRVRDSIRVGIHWDTQVRHRQRRNAKRTAEIPQPSMCTPGQTTSGETEAQQPHRVTQVFCSAVPISYAKSTTATNEWEQVARVVLEAAYEATLAAAAVLAAERGKRCTVFLTALGGGAFGNPTTWIVDAVERALTVHRHAALDVKLVHFGARGERSFQELEERSWRRSAGVAEDEVKLAATASSSL